MEKKQLKVLGFRPSDNKMVKKLKADAKRDNRSISYILDEITNWFYRNYTSIKDVEK